VGQNEGFSVGHFEELGRQKGVWGGWEGGEEYTNGYSFSLTVREVYITKVMAVLSEIDDCRVCDVVAIDEVNVTEASAQGKFHDRAVCNGTFTQCDGH
jgi:hypothetical protein